MAGINKAILIGNLGRDPEIRYTQQNNAVASLSVATTRSYFNKTTNERVEETEWHRVTLWGKDAENAAKYLTKGRQVYVEGRLQTRKYEDKDGVTRYSTDIVGETIQYLGGRGGEAGGDDSEAENDGGGRGRSGGERQQSQRGEQRQQSGGGQRNGGGQRSGQQSRKPEPEPHDSYIPDAPEDDIPF